MAAQQTFETCRCWRTNLTHTVNNASSPRVSDGPARAQSWSAATDVTTCSLQPICLSRAAEATAHFEALHGVFQAGHQVHVCVHCLVAHVALYKHLSWLEAQDLVGLRQGAKIKLSQLSAQLCLSELCCGGCHEGPVHLQAGRRQRGGFIHPLWQAAVSWQPTGTRESEHPIQRYSGVCCFTRRLKKSGSRWRMSAAQSLHVHHWGKQCLEQHEDEHRIVGSKFG